MTNEPSLAQTSRTPIRLWPGLLAAGLLIFFRLVLPWIVPEALIAGLIGTAACAAAIVVWWLFFSRAAWSERIGAIAGMIVALLATSRLVHASIAGGAMGGLLYLLAVPVLAVALVAWAAASRRLPDGLRRAALAATILAACGLFTLVRTSGTTSDVIGSELHWRWTPTPEERLLAAASDEPAPQSAPTPEATPDPAGGAAPAGSPTPAATASPKGEPSPAAPAVEKRAAWPGFRGPERDGVVRGVRINADWAAAPPAEIWRRQIGPGWSSFAVRGDYLYTQEQRGDEELVACYKVSTGEPVWRHRDPVRFWESNGGAGPRATPTISGDRVYAFGATGVLNALSAANGKRLWSRNVAADTGRKVPTWGFASSPLVMNDLVVVAAAGTLAAYDANTGDLRWRGPAYDGSYSSPHRVTIDGVPQIVLLGGPGAISVAPADGAVLWEHTWSSGAIVQPALTPDGDLLVNALAPAGGLGLRRLHVAQQSGGGWTQEERWTSNGLKPYFNDFVLHKGHAFGFDGSILSSIDLRDGKRKWKGGRYGNGQLVLLREQDLLLVLSEEGELALVGATADQFRELARFPALKAKTWNHPAMVGDVLLVRNGEEMAAFRLALADR